MNLKRGQEKFSQSKYKGKKRVREKEIRAHKNERMLWKVLSNIPEKLESQRAEQSRQEGSEEAVEQM